MFHTEACAEGITQSDKKRFPFFTLTLFLPPEKSGKSICAYTLYKLLPRHSLQMNSPVYPN
jgi:hypothetical protein